MNDKKNNEKGKIILPRRKFLERVEGGLTAIAALNIPILASEAGKAAQLTVISGRFFKTLLA
jgi:hypothetical protein